VTDVSDQRLYLCAEWRPVHNFQNLHGDFSGFLFLLCPTTSRENEGRMQVLEQLENDHPLPKLVLEHRSRCKLLDGFLTDICSRVRRPSIGPQGQ